MNTSSHLSTPAHFEGSVPPSRRRKAILASSVGTVIEWYDYMAYAFMAITISAVFFPADATGVGLLSTLAVFGVSFLFRPLGGILFGWIADRFGRRPALFISVIGMAITSSLIGLLPGHLAVGVLAPILLVLLRSLQGIAAGGEMASAATYASEASTVRRRGLDVSFVNLGMVAGTALSAVIVAILYALLSPEQMVEWGWRVPFLLSIPMGIIALVIRRHMEESAEFDQVQNSSPTKRSPIWLAFKLQPREVFLVAALNLGHFATFYIVFTYLPTYFRAQEIMTASQASWSVVLALTIAAATTPIWGWLSDKIGRRPVLLIASGSLTVCAYPLFLLMQHGVTQAVIGHVIFAVLEGGFLGVVLAACTELFKPGIRVSGIAIGYNLGSVLAGGPAAYASQWLIQATGIVQAPSFFLITATTLSLLAALFAYRETAGRPLIGQTELAASAAPARV